MNANDRRDLEPFSVPAKVLKPSAHDPGAGEAAGPPAAPAVHRSAPEPVFPESTGLNALAAVLFAVIFVLVERNPAFSALTVLVLLASTLYRLPARHRRIAAAPVVFASMLLACQITDACSRLVQSPAGSMFQQAPVPTADMVAPWLPLFFAACLFYMPRYETVTGHILMIISVLLLVSGLLPGNGFEVIFFTIQYFLFIAIVVGLGIDFTRGTTAPAASASAPSAH